MAERRRLLIAHALENLREGLEQMRRLARGLAGLREHGQDLERGNRAVAGGRDVAEHDMAGLLAADVIAALGHLLEFVTIVDLGTDELEVEALEIAVQAGIRHHRAYDAAALEAPHRVPRRGEQR